MGMIKQKGIELGVVYPTNNCGDIRGLEINGKGWTAG